MSVIIPDEALLEAGLDERDALVEFACRLFDAGKLALPSAARLATLHRSEFERELGLRGIAAYRPSLEDLADDIAALDRLGP